MKKKRDPKTDPCGAPALSFCHFEDWPLRTLL